MGMKRTVYDGVDVATYLSQLPSSTSDKAQLHNPTTVMKGSWKEVEVCYHCSSRLDVHSLQGNTVYHIRSQEKDIFNGEDYFYKGFFALKSVHWQI